MNRRFLIMGALILAIPMLYLAYWLGSPLFREDKVDEALPDDIVFISPTVPDTGEDVDLTLTALPTQAILSDVATETPPPPVATDHLMDEAMPEESQVTATEIKRGMFRDGDSLHEGSGDAILFALSDGRHLVRFDNFRVTNGPDLHVYLVPKANASGAVDITDYVDLGMLKGNSGSQNYFVEADVQITDELSIVIWCEPFRVLFSVASLN